MNRTFTIISPHFQHFKENDWSVWFHLKLVPILPSFSPVMLKNATTNVNCTSYHVVVSGMAKAFPAMPLHRRQGITDVLLGYLRKSANVINEPGGRCGLLSPNQKAELILDPDSGALEDEAIIRKVFTSLTESPDDEQLKLFFQAFTNINKQQNITIITNPGVRDTILNLTLTALAGEFEDFEAEDFQLWFQVNLAPVMASLRPDSLVVIPSDISCASYAAILTGLQQSLKSLPLHLSQGVISSIDSLKETFTRCSVPDSFTCKETLVDEDLICAAVDRSQLEQTLSSGNSPEALCNFTITQHACSSATHLTASNLVTLMKCSLESQRTYPVEVWKLFFQKLLLH
ncbi:uncharacterized protein LOC122862224 [Siniperca chuatsi]|uniref:uncharacterized protein LOC122862224 n=1 Tax=Siniperca chuatsi TaxID=119488 RepID=UPI001CE0DF89|nr:uncharacterized protein LOC122862224 [Siniperca chuatsi]